MPETTTETAPKDTTTAPPPCTPRGATPIDVQANTTRSLDADKAAEEARNRDNTARRESEVPRPPTGRELDKLRKDRFGDGSGTIHTDVDLATGATTLVYLDGGGEELAREPFTPDGETAPTTRGTTTTARVENPPAGKTASAPAPTMPPPVKQADRPR